MSRKEYESAKLHWEKAQKFYQEYEAHERKALEFSKKLIVDNLQGWAKHNICIDIEGSPDCTGLFLHMWIQMNAEDTDMCVVEDLYYDRLWDLERSPEFIGQLIGIRVLGKDYHSDHWDVAKS